MVLVLPVPVGYTKMAGMVVHDTPIAAAQSVVVCKAALEVARAVAGSWYTPSINRYLLFPQRYDGNGRVQ